MVFVVYLKSISAFCGVILPAQLSKYTQRIQNMCIPFIQRRPTSSTLGQHCTNVIRFFLCLLGSCFAYNAMLPLGISERLMDQLETMLCLMFSFFFEDSMVSYIKDNVFYPHVTCIASPSDTHYVV